MSEIDGIRRIDPRRPYHITPAGVPRIVLGELAGANVQALGTRVGHAQQAKPLRTRAAVPSWLMAIAHSDRGRLDEHARQAIAAAAILATPDSGVIAVVLGELHEDLASLGVDRVAVFPELDFASFQPERELAAASRLIDAYAPLHVFLPDNVQGDGDLGRRLIAAHADSAATHVVELDAQHVASYWSRGAEFARADLPRFVLLEAGAVESSLPFVGAAELADVPDAVPAVRQAGYRDRGLEELDAAQIALEEADFIISAGNGVREVVTLEALARTLGAAVGASRVAVDEGKFPRDKQIGATGKTVSASTYVAVGISGAVQHLQGIKDCRHVIAINRDAGAPIVKRADLTLIGDAEEIMQALLVEIGRGKGGDKDGVASLQEAA